MHLYNRQKDRFKLYVTEKMDFEAFNRNIKNYMELNYEWFRGLTGLKIRELRTKMVGSSHMKLSHDKSMDITVNSSLNDTLQVKTQAYREFNKMYVIHYNDP